MHCWKYLNTKTVVPEMAKRLDSGVARDSCFRRPLSPVPKAIEGYETIAEDGRTDESSLTRAATLQDFDEMSGISVLASTSDLCDDHGA